MALEGKTIGELDPNTGLTLNTLIEVEQQGTPKKSEKSSLEDVKTLFDNEKAFAEVNNKDTNLPCTVNLNAIIPIDTIVEEKNCTLNNNTVTVGKKGIYLINVQCDRITVN